MLLELMLFISAMMLLLFIALIIIFYMFIRSNQRMISVEYQITELRAVVNNNNLAFLKWQKEMCELINASNWFLEKISNRLGNLNDKKPDSSKFRYPKKVKEPSKVEFEAKVF